MHAIRGLKRALNDSGRWRYKSPEAVVDHVVIGGGVVGLAIAQRLTKEFPAKSTYLIERHAMVGEEVSSRNSEVIHSGLYYPPSSLKTTLCLRGRDLMYSYCNAHSVPYKRTGKLVVATHPAHLPYLESLHHKASSILQWPSYLLSTDPSLKDTPLLPTKLISGEEAREMEPDLSPGVLGALWVKDTGIVDSHTLMQSLQVQIQGSENGEVVLGTRVVRIDKWDNVRSQRPEGVEGVGRVESGWVVQLLTQPPAASSAPEREQELNTDTILTPTLINAAGLSSTYILNALLKPSERLLMYYAKGSYAKYTFKGEGVKDVKHLIYPCPEIPSSSVSSTSERVATAPGDAEAKDATPASTPAKESTNAHAFQSLGTHLTLDLDGNVRFGPDLEWIDASSSTEGETDFWTSHLTPFPDRIPSMHKAITSYLPNVKLEGLAPDYSGMRPKLIPPGGGVGGFQDFVVRVDWAVPKEFISAGSSSGKVQGPGGQDAEKKEAEVPQGQMISLLGIESPGLTSSLAIAEYVVGQVLRDGREEGASCAGTNAKAAIKEEK